MTEPKHISQSLKTLLINPMVLDTLDRTKDIEGIAIVAKEFWNYDLYARKPSPAYDDYGVFNVSYMHLPAEVRLSKFPITNQAPEKPNEQIKSVCRKKPMAKLLVSKGIKTFSNSPFRSLIKM